jgi:outer membrane receptor protein involved in Fe transport
MDTHSSTQLGKQPKTPAGDPRPVIADYKTVDLALRADSVLQDDVAGRWTLTASVRNLFNANAREPALPLIEDDLPLPGRSFMLEASVAL